MFWWWSLGTGPPKRIPRSIGLYYIQCDKNFDLIIIIECAIVQEAILVLFAVGGGAVTG